MEVKLTSHNQTASNGAKNILVSQQKLASQLPRGTRLDPTGSCLELKGARNFCARPIGVGTDEMYDDIVLRGLRADGLSTKLGVKNSREYIAKLVSDLFARDSRKEIVLQHYKTKRQRSNCAKTIFATMANDELKMIKDELIPARVDVNLKNCITDVFAKQTNKLETTIQVLQRIQDIFSQVLPECEFLSGHNFHSRGFFLDVFLHINDFIMQILGDVCGHEQQDNFHPSNHLQQEVEVTHDAVGEESVAEILLSVGAAATANNNQSVSNQKVAHNKRLPKVVEEDNKEWMTVGVLDSGGQTKYLLVKTPKEMDGAIEADKLLELINNPNTMVVHDSGEPKSFLSENQELSLKNIGTESTSNTHLNDTGQLSIISSETNLTNHGISPITTLEISIPDNPDEHHLTDALGSEMCEEIPAKRRRQT